MLTIHHVMPEQAGDKAGAVTKAAKAGYAGGDYDLQVTKDSHLVLSHDAKFLGCPIANLPLAEFLKLAGAQSAYGALDEAKAAQRLFIPCFEIKPGVGTHQPLPYQRLKDYADKIGQPFALMTLRRYPYDNSAKAKAWEESAVLRIEAINSVGLTCGILWHPTSGAGATIADPKNPLLQAMAWGKGVPSKQKLRAGVIRVPQNSASYAAAIGHLKSVAYMPTTKPKPPEVPVSIALRVDGIDISHHQTTALDFAAAKKAGLKFVYHKATEGKGVTDDKYAARRVQVARAGLPCGAYHYGWPGSSSGASQAQRFLHVAAVKNGDMLPVLDLEQRDGFTQKKLTAWVGSFVAEVKKEIGSLPIIYTPFPLDDNFGCNLWVARYSNTNTPPVIPKPWKRATIRQFSNGVFGVPNTLAGIGHVDLNTLPAGIDLEDLRIGGLHTVSPLPNLVEQAIASCASQSKSGPKFGVNQCQMRCRLAYNVASDGTPTAAAWWAKSKRRHPTGKPAEAPRGAFHYFTGGSSKAGHVMISTGGTRSWSTDTRRTGYFDLTTVEAVLKAWPKLRYVGWTEDIDGVWVLDPAARNNNQEGSDMALSKGDLEKIKSDNEELFKRYVGFDAIAVPKDDPDYNPKNPAIGQAEGIRRLLYGGKHKATS